MTTSVERPFYVNERFHELFVDDRRWQVVYGGAGSGKSYALGQRTLLRAMSAPRRRTLIVRKVAKTLRNSCFALMLDVIAQEGWAAAWRISQADMRMTCKLTGSEVLFVGLDDPEKLKSIAGITDAWVEEASELAETDLEQLNLRIRGKSPVPKQLAMSFNPIDQQHWIKRRFFDTRSDDVLIHHSTYADNDGIDPEYRQQLENLRITNEQWYRIYCLGEWGAIGNVVFSNFVIDEFDAYETSRRSLRFKNPSVGMDFGFNHASVIVKCGWLDGELYAYEELSATGLTNSEFIEAASGIVTKGERITADSAEPARIKEWRRRGYHVHAAKKGKDSVRNGLDFLKSQRIHIHRTQCPNLARWLPLMKYREVARTGEITDEPLEIHDDEVSALRYAVEDVRRATMQTPPRAVLEALGAG